MRPKSKPRAKLVAPFIFRYHSQATGECTYSVKIERLGFKVSQGGFASRLDAMDWRDEQLKLAPPSQKGKSSRSRAKRLAHTLSRFNPSTTP